MKTTVKIIKCPPRIFVLDKYLRPGYCIGHDNLIHMVMAKYQTNRCTAENIVCDTVSECDYYNYSYHDRQKLHLPGL